MKTGTAAPSLIPGQPSRLIERIGRDRESAIAAWNTRASSAQSAPAAHPDLMEQRRIRSIVDAALQWYAAIRPACWSFERHLENHTQGCSNEYERDIARAIQLAAQDGSLAKYLGEALKGDAK